MASAILPGISGRSKPKSLKEQCRQPHAEIKQLVRDMNSNSLTRSEYDAADDMLDELYQERERLWLKAMEDGENCYL